CPLIFRIGVLILIGRTHQCGKLREKHVGEKVRLKGWVQRRRDLGGVIFIDLRDRSGIVQVVFHPDESSKALETAETVRNEYVLDVTGKVVQRDAETYNAKIDTGTIEVQVESVTVINAAKTPPLEITDDIDVADEIRLKYRYLD